MLEFIFYQIDNFCKQYENQLGNNLLSDGKNQRKRELSLSMSEVITIMIFYHHSGYKNFKDYYTKHVEIYMQNDFKKLVSYNRFLELRARALPALCMFLNLKGLGKSTGISVIDSFPLPVCHNKRIYSHKTFKGIAKRGKTSVGWFYGFKVHIVINHPGELIAFAITPGNVSDNNEKLLLKITKDLCGKLFGDRGYIVRQNLFETLYTRGIHLITKIRKNMKNKLMPFDDKLGLRKRGVVESVGNVLKAGLSLAHTRHRSIVGFFGHIISTLVAYSFKEKKPSITGLSSTQFVIC